MTAVAGTAESYCFVVAFARAVLEILGSDSESCSAWPRELGQNLQ